MIQFNLLPDVKIEYVKATRTKRLVTGIALLTTAVTCGIFLLLAGVTYGVQKKSLGDLDRDIAQKTKELNDTPELNKILTIQNQLNALDGLHANKVVTTRTFGYIEQFTPKEISISDIQVDYTANTIAIVGEAPTLEKVNVFTDTLKYSTYKVDDGTENKKAFSSVVLTQFTKLLSEGASYTISFSYDPELFNSDSEVELIVPKEVTTNSVKGQPTVLFKKLDVAQEDN